MRRLLVLLLLVLWMLTGCLDDEESSADGAGREGPVDGVPDGVPDEGPDAPDLYGFEASFHAGTALGTPQTGVLLGTNITEAVVVEIKDGVVDVEAVADWRCDRGPCPFSFDVQTPSGASVAVFSGESPLYISWVADSPGEWRVVLDSQSLATGVEGTITGQVTA